MTTHTFTPEQLAAHNAAIRSAALAEAVTVLDAYSEYDRPLCCDGRECGCYGESVFDTIKHYTLALAATPPGMVCVSLTDMPKSIAAEILADVTDRRGWRHEYDGFDQDVRDEINATWEEKIRALLAAHGGKE